MSGNGAGGPGGDVAPPFQRLALRPKEAAEALGISERKLREILPELPYVRLGGAVLLPVEALRAWLIAEVKAEKGRVEAVAEEVLRAIGPTGN